MFLTPRASGSINLSHITPKGSINSPHISSQNTGIAAAPRYPLYRGPFIFYPTDSFQTIPVANLNVPLDIIIYPIPDLPLQQVAVEPSAHEDIEVRADEGYYALEQVTVLKIPYEEIDNALGGKTVKIGH